MNKLRIAGQHSPPAARAFDTLSLLAVAALGSLAFVRVMSLPAFEDEGSQLHLIRRMGENGEWLQPLIGGKPLEVWPMSLFVCLHLHPALPGIRLLHVAVGLLGAALTYTLALRTGDRRLALASAALFVACPFVVYLERLALSDIFLCTAYLWACVATIGFLESPTRRRALALSAALLLAAFCKFPVGFAALVIVPLVLLLAPRTAVRPLAQSPARARLAGAILPVLALFATVFAVAFTQFRRGSTLGFGLHDLLVIGASRDHAIASAIGVARPELLAELAAQLSWPVLLLALAGIIHSAGRGDWRDRWLVACGALPLLAVALLPQFWFSRYLLFSLPPLMIAAVHGWNGIAVAAGRFARPLRAGVLVFALGTMAWRSAPIILDPVRAHWSPVDRFQYVEGWGSGYGYPEAARFLLTTHDTPERIFTLDSHSAEQLLTYLPAQWTPRIRPIADLRGTGLASQDPLCERELVRHPDAWVIAPVQLVRRRLEGHSGSGCAGPLELHEIARFDKPGVRAQVGIYEIVQR